MSVLKDAVATYKETRNGLIGVDYSTKFSPWWVQMHHYLSAPAC